MYGILRHQSRDVEPFLPSPCATSVLSKHLVYCSLEMTSFKISGNDLEQEVVPTFQLLPAG